MPEDEPDEDETTQFTPKGHEIPIPTRGMWDKLLGRVAKGAGSNGHDAKGDKSG